MAKTIKVNFVDFWPNFNKIDNYFFNLLGTKYKVVVDENNPDLLFFSVDYAKQRERNRYINHSCKKIFYTGENVRPNFDFGGSIEEPRYSIGKCDYAFTFDHTLDPRNFRLPLWVLFIDWFGVPHNDNRDPSYLISLENLFNRNGDPKNKFCNFIFSNNSGPRLSILDSIAKYRHVDCAGPLKNNLGYRIPGRADQKYKLEFLKDYKFTIAAENSSHPGYATEKIIHPLSVGSIPIYWGSDTICEDFNKGAFIDVKEYDSLSALTARVTEIDQNHSLYEKYLSEPIFSNNEIPSCFLPENVLIYIQETILC